MQEPMQEFLKNSETVHRPWGSFTRFIKNEPSTVKIVSVNAKQSLSLQYHNHRAEFWHVISGVGSVVIGDTTYEATQGKDFYVPVMTHHRIIADTALEILEIALGTFDEEDIVRLEDTYGRDTDQHKTIEQ